MNRLFILDEEKVIEDLQTDDGAADEMGDRAELPAVWRRVNSLIVTISQVEME